MNLNQKIKSKEFHIWDFPNSTYILIEEKIRRKYFNSIFSYYGSKRKAAKSLGITLGTIRNYENAFSVKYGLRHPQYIPISFFKKTTQLFNKNLIYKIEKNTIAISARNGLDVKNPILPIKESPAIYRIIAHILADGSASKGKTAYYANNAELLRKQFVNDLKIFGDFETKERNVGNTIGIYFPKAITDIISFIFDIRFTNPNRIPIQLFYSTNKSKSEFLKALFDDEGSVTHNTVIGIHNENLLNQLKNLLLEFNINTTKISKTPYITKKGTKYKMTFQIIKKDLIKFQNEINFNHPEKSKKLKLMIQKQNNR